MAGMFIFLCVATARATATYQGASCTFTPNCDYGHGSRDSAPASTKEDCCNLCRAKEGCAAGVLSGNACWFKTAEQVAAGCQHSGKVQFACINGNAPAPPPAPPSCASAACQALETKYAALRNTTCKAVASQAPTPDAAALGAFMKLYQNFTGDTDEAPVLAAAQTVLADPKMQAFLTLPDSFGSGGLDEAMVTCALISEATPTALAEFAVVNAAQEALVTKLLGDAILMRDMLVAGGATSSETDKGQAGPKRYGEAMAIYEQLVAASDELRTSAAVPRAGAPWDDRSQTTILKRLALGTALEHAVPIHLHYHTKQCDEAYDWCPTPPKDANVSVVDPVARYLHYERAYKAGELDPAFEVLTAFEAKHTSNSPGSDEDLEWVRQSMGIYRPDHIARDYGWRYAEAVRQEVAYGDPQCAKWGAAVCAGHYAQIPASDGVCGPRAFFGRFTRLAFGLPTWGATQPGHAAMTTWSPTGGTCCSAPRGRRAGGAAARAPTSTWRRRRASSAPTSRRCCAAGGSRLHSARRPPAPTGAARAARAASARAARGARSCCTRRRSAWRARRPCPAPSAPLSSPPRSPRCSPSGQPSCPRQR